MPDKKKEYTEIIKSSAQKHGFDGCGISKAEPLEKEAENFKQWIQETRHGEMKFMENYFEKRTDPAKLIPGTKSIVSVILNYYPAQTQKNDTYKISKYAYGTDYHKIIKKKLKSLLQSIQENIEDEVSGRYFVDSAPVMDKVWAQKSGLGWIGKNTNLITRQFGSYVFIGEILLNIELDYDSPAKDYCGSCTKCLEVCPTHALDKPYQIDASQCISYLTIEKKGELPEKMKNTLEDWIFGCDICQDVCPWNRKPVLHNIPDFAPPPELTEFSKTNWESLSEERYNQIFKKSAVKRTGYQGLMRNIQFNNKS
ncbi:MAG: tRNA epoxyqueuosine(34) reductase QueG [Bacteroidales bacterium]